MATPFCGGRIDICGLDGNVVVSDATMISTEIELIPNYSHNVVHHIKAITNDISFVDSSGFSQVFSPAFPGSGVCAIQINRGEKIPAHIESYETNQSPMYMTTSITFSITVNSIDLEYKIKSDEQEEDDMFERWEILDLRRD